MLLQVGRLGGAGCMGGEQEEEAQCGRVLGLTFTAAGRLLVCDAVFGLYILDLEVEVEPGRISDQRPGQRVRYTPLLTPQQSNNRWVVSEEENIQL